MIAHQIRAFGFDLTLGMGDRQTSDLNPLEYFRLRTLQSLDFEHILTAGHFCLRNGDGNV